MPLFSMLLLALGISLLWLSLMQDSILFVFNLLCGNKDLSFRWSRSFYRDQHNPFWMLGQNLIENCRLWQPSSGRCSESCLVLILSSEFPTHPNFVFGTVSSGILCCRGGRFAQNPYFIWGKWVLMADVFADGTLCGATFGFTVFSTLSCINWKGATRGFAPSRDQSKYIPICLPAHCLHPTAIYPLSWKHWPSQPNGAGNFSSSDYWDTASRFGPGGRMRPGCRILHVARCSLYCTPNTPFFHASPAQHGRTPFVIGARELWCGGLLPA